MGQKELFDYLKKNKGKKFTVYELAEIMDKRVNYIHAKMYKLVSEKSIRTGYIQERRTNGVTYSIKQYWYSK